MKISPISNMMLANIDSPEFFGDLTVPEPLVSDNDTSPATKLFVENATKAYSYYYRNCYNIQTIATVGAQDSKLIFDTSGNLYWAVNNQYNGTSNPLTSYLYKITPAGTLTTFASAVLNVSSGSDLKFDASGNLYWAFTQQANVAANYNLTSYIYKITPAGTVTTFATAATVGGTGTSLVFDTSGNLYWAVSNYRSTSGATFNLTSYVYKITPAGTLTTFASAATNGTYQNSLAFDTSGNLYWAVANQQNGSTFNLTSYVYKITPAGTLTTFASVATNGANGTSLAFDVAGNLYWEVSNYYNGTTYNLTSYVYKITSAGSMTTFASQATNGATGTSLVFDSAGNLYWAISNHYNGTSYSQTSYVYKITSAGSMTTFASQATTGASGTSLAFDASGNLYWAQSYAHNGTTYSINSYLHVMTKHSIL